MSTQTTTEKRKVTRIVFDRPPLKKLSFVLFSLAGLALGLLLALLLHWFNFGLGNVAASAASSEQQATLLTFFTVNECWEWYSTLGVVGLAAGLAFGWGYGREVKARTEVVEQTVTQRRRSTSTAMVRADYGRRW